MAARKNTAERKAPLELTSDAVEVAKMFMAFAAHDRKEVQRFIVIRRLLRRRAAPDNDVGFPPAPANPEWAEFEDD